ncbi:PREDICTED: uncharacterized protein LOC104707663 [Camelina sativa]|uniref:Uncharacterized protein LOC104707663 n=1 Tax=Camelina sativa TaxID=90675 RepID=A0ABM0T890_CAMSA|nr:PREDICTED: uncharacterized protein LOC104707663 [Camelina sativa]
MMEGRRIIANSRPCGGRSVVAKKRSCPMDSSTAVKSSTPRNLASYGSSFLNQHHSREILRHASRDAWCRQQPSCCFVKQPCVSSLTHFTFQRFASIAHKDVRCLMRICSTTRNLCMKPVGECAQPNYKTPRRRIRSNRVQMKELRNLQNR